MNKVIKKLSKIIKIYDEYDHNVEGEEWKVVQHKRQTKPIEPKQLPPKPGKAGKHSRFATMRSTTKTVPSAVELQDADGRPMSEGKSEVPKGPPTNLMIGPNSPPLHQGDLQPQRPYLLPPQGVIAESRYRNQAYNTTE